MFQSVAVRSRKAIYSAALAVTLLVGASPLALAQAPAAAAVSTPPAPVIVVVDVQRIMRDSLAAKSIQSQLSAQRNNVQKEFAKRNDDLRNLQADLARQAQTLPQDQLAQKRKDFEQKVADFQHDAADREQAFARTQEDAQNRVLQVFINVVQDIAKERGANMVMSKQAVVLVAQPFDITEDALRRLDQRIQTVAVSTPRASSSENAPAPQAATTPAKKR